MIRNILRKLGFVHTSEIEGYRNLESNPFTEGELSYLLAKELGHEDIDFPEKEQTKLFKALKNVDGLTEYLKFTAMNDKNRYFGATTKDEQSMIRGAFARTLYLRGKIVNPKTKLESSTKIQGVRYDK